MQFMDLYLRGHWLDVFNEIVSIGDGALLQIVDDQIEPRFGNNINQLWKHLQRALATAKHNLCQCR